MVRRGDVVVSSELNFYHNLLWQHICDSKANFFHPAPLFSTCFVMFAVFHCETFAWNNYFPSNKRLSRKNLPFIEFLFTTCLISWLTVHLSHLQQKSSFSTWFSMLLSLASSPLCWLCSTRHWMRVNPSGSSIMAWSARILDSDSDQCLQSRTSRAPSYGSRRQTIRTQITGLELWTSFWNVSLMTVQAAVFTTKNLKFQLTLKRTRKRRRTAPTAQSTHPLKTEKCVALI